MQTGPCPQISGAAEYRTARYLSRDFPDEAKIDMNESIYMGCMTAAYQ
jgi:hypothetical protein